MQSQIQIFKEAHKRFNEALLYIEKNLETLKKDPQRFAQVQKNFKTKFEDPLDKSWDDLSIEEQNSLGTLYLLRREAANEEIKEIKEIAELFHGKIESIQKKNNS